MVSPFGEKQCHIRSFSHSVLEDKFNMELEVKYSKDTQKDYFAITQLHKSMCETLFKTMKENIEVFSFML